MSSSHLIEARARVEELVNKCGDEEEKETALINSPPQTVADKIQIMPSLSDRSSEAEWQMANMQAIQEFGSFRFYALVIINNYLIQSVIINNLPSFILFPF